MGDSKRPHYRLEAWKVAMELVTEVYAASRGFPKEEVFALTSQVRRSAISIPSNIAEGAARNGKKEFVQFIGVAKGSLSELETQLLIAVGLGYLDSDHALLGKVTRLSSLLAGLHRSIARAGRLPNHPIT